MARPLPQLDTIQGAQHASPVYDLYASAAWDLVPLTKGTAFADTAGLTADSIVRGVVSDYEGTINVTMGSGAERLIPVFKGYNPIQITALAAGGSNTGNLYAIL